MTMITFDALADEVLRLADEHPEAVYAIPNGESRCRYLIGQVAGGCGCLFGQALMNLGVSNDALDTADRRGTSIGGLMPQLGIVADSVQSLALIRVQRSQDIGVRWFSAVQPLREYREREATR